MRGTDRHGDFMTTDLLSVWTDPDTAMEVVGRSLGIFGEVSNPTSLLSTDSRLRNALHGVLVSLVEGGVLEMRPCGGGRYAFRWRDDIASAVVSSAEDTPAASKPTSTDDPFDPAWTERTRQWPRLVAPTAPLVFPASSCILALLVFVRLGHAFALVIAAALMLVGVIGLVRRVPFAGLWTIGLVLAGLLLRFS